MYKNINIYMIKKVNILIKIKIVHKIFQRKKNEAGLGNCVDLKCAISGLYFRFQRFQASM